MIKKLLMLSLCGLAGSVVFTPSEAQSATIGGHSGHGWPNSALNCFQGSFSDMLNNCAANNVLVVPVTVTKVGVHTVRVRARGNGTANFTTCRAIRNDQNNGGFLSAALSTGSTAYTTLALGTINVPSADTLSFECNVAPVSGAFRGSVLNVNWF
jgi:hypothetical protein